MANYWLALSTTSTEASKQQWICCQVFACSTTPLPHNIPMVFPFAATCYACVLPAPQQLQPQLALHIGDTTIQMPFSAAQAQQLDAALATLLQTFADKQEAKRPRR